MRKEIDIDKIETNDGQIEGVPQNPRYIKDANFEYLKKSIQDAPDMLELREVIVYPLKGKYVCIGGNMRYQACKELGYEKMWCKVLKKETDAKTLRAYIVKDNLEYGQDDINALNEWDKQELKDWCKGTEIEHSFDFDRYIDDNETNTNFLCLSIELLKHNYEKAAGKQDYYTI